MGFFGFISELKARLSYWDECDRIGPDVLSTHWRLYFRSTMLALCRKKFKHFDETAEVRPGVYAVGCSRISIGRRVVLRPGVCLHGNPEGEEIRIEDDVMLGQGVHIYVDNHKYSDPDVPIIDQGFCSSKSVTIKKGAWLGANVIVLPGVTIGANSVVGAGSVVTKSVPDRVMAAGCPAKVIREICPQR